MENENKNAIDGLRSLSDPSDSDGENRWKYVGRTFGHMPRTQQNYNIHEDLHEDLPILKIPDLSVEDEPVKYYDRGQNKVAASHQTLIPAGIRDDIRITSGLIQKNSEMPYWIRAIGKVLLICILCVKAWYYTEMMINHIRHGDPLSPNLLPGTSRTSRTSRSADVGINLAIVILLYSFETVVMYGGPLQITLQGWMPLKWHRILGIISTGSSILVGWLGLVCCILDQTLEPIEKISFSIYWVIMICNAILVIITGYRASDTLDRDPKYLKSLMNVELSHTAWALRMYALSIGIFIYKMLYMLVRDDNSSLEIVIVLFFYVPPLVIVELILISIRYYRKN